MHSVRGIPERRLAQRFRVEVPVELAYGKGLTRDVSACGVYFQTDGSFSPGEQVKFTLVLQHLAPMCSTRLLCWGEVVRVEHYDGKVGVAVAIGDYRFDA